MTGSSPLSKNVELWHNSNSGWVKELSIENEALKYLVTANNEPQAYLETINANSERHKIYRLYQTPYINKTTAGAWFDPNFDRQGITINHGVRGDNSEYLFVTVYTFDSGKPLWLAGVIELTENMDVATVQLFSYEGLNLWQDNTPATEGQLGTMTIKHRRCDLLDVTFEISGVTQSIQAQRMDNKAIQSSCHD
mgnify:CR=1 FL=1